MVKNSCLSERSTDRTVQLGDKKHGVKEIPFEALICITTRGSQNMVESNFADTRFLPYDSLFKIRQFELTVDFDVKYQFLWSGTDQN